MSFLIMLSYIIFWAILPSIIIYYRYRKKIKTGFALSGIFAVFLLGLILSASFQERPEKKFVKFMNENSFDEAKQEFRYILQKSHDNLKNIDIRMMRNSAEFERIKKSLSDEYILIAEKCLGDFKINDTDCNSLFKERAKLDRMNSALRLLRMAESIGKDQSSNKEILKKKIKDGERIIHAVEERCR